MAEKPEIIQEKLLSQAQACFEREDHTKLRALCQEILEQNAAHVQAHNLLGSSFARTREFKSATRYFMRATELEPNNPALWINLGETFAFSDALAEALSSFQRALSLAPNAAYAHLALGNLYTAKGKFPKALSCYYRANRFKPKDPSILFNYGVALMSDGQYTDAIKSLLQVLTLKPDHLQAIYRIGKSHIALNQVEEAALHYERSLEQFPDDTELHHALGQCATRQKQPTKALFHLQRAHHASPDLKGLKNNLAVAFHDVGRSEESLDMLNALVEELPLSHLTHSNRLLTAHYSTRLSNPELATLHREAGAALTTSHPNPFTDYPQSRSPDRRLRVGFISPDFRSHPVGYFLLPVFRHLNRSGFELYCYSDVPHPDQMTTEFKELSDHFFDSSDSELSHLLSRIRSDQIDLLLDLAGHTAKNRLPLFALKPAPVQLSGFGYVNTTGLNTMDYLLTDSIQCPPGSEPLYTETLARLPNDYICYAPPPDLPEVGPLPALKKGHLTLGCLNRLAKLTPDTIQLWCELLAELPNARLVIRSNGLADAPLAQNYRQLFEERGLESERLTLLGGATHQQFLQTYQSIDIALDPFPYSGGLITCEALWMGVPVVTLRGQRFASLHSSSHLTHAGLGEWVTDSKRDYIETVARWADNLPALALLRATLRAQASASPLGDGPRYAQDFEATLRSCWRRWCEKENDESNP